MRSPSTAMGLQLVALCLCAGSAAAKSVLSANATDILRSGKVHRQQDFIKQQFAKMLRSDIFMLGQKEAFKRDDSFNPATPDPPLATEVDMSHNFWVLHSLPAAFGRV